MKLLTNFLFVILISSLFVSSAWSQVQVKGYYRKDGTYVQPHVRSNPDGNPRNNWSYPGNTNPYTGKTATGSTEAYLKNYNKNSSSTGDLVYVEGYYRSDGTYVKAHFRSAPNGILEDNLSYKPANSTNDDLMEYIKKQIANDALLKQRLNEAQYFENLHSSAIQHKVVTERHLSPVSHAKVNHKVDEAIKYNQRYSMFDRRDIELKLQKLGYYIGVVDGNFDENTVNAIKQFQENEGIAIDGKIGTQTMRKLVAKFN